MSEDCAMTLLQMSGMGTVLILWVLLLRRLAGNRLPPLCYLLLWLVVGLRLAVPVVLPSPCSVYQLFVQKQPVLVEAPVAVQTGAAMPAPVPVEMVEQSMVPWLTILWMMGLLLCLFCQLFSHWRCRRWYATSLPAEDSAVQQWQRQHPLWRKYQIRRSQLVQVPLTYGLLRPVIVLPMQQAASRNRLSMVLLHEWNHIRHWDVLWQWGLVLICSLHWFNPAVWLMALVCRQDLELFCDEATARQLSATDRRDYALLLLQTASEARQIPLFSQFCHTGYRRMQERVQMIMQKKQYHWRTAVITVCLVVAACLLFTTSAVAAEGNGQLALQWPVAYEKSVVTSAFGNRIHPITKTVLENDHICIGGEGIKGAAVVAAADGVVLETGYTPSYGNYVIVAHKGALTAVTHYRHCDTVTVQQHQQVTSGEQIGTVGQTGMATGPCLAFAVYQNGVACDPMKYFSKVE